MKQVVKSEKCAKALGPYSAGISVDSFVFLSKQVFVNMKNLLESQGLTYSDIIKTTVFLSDISDFGKVNEEYGKYFEGAYPARSCFEVACLPKNAKVEIECIAWRKK